MSYKPGGIVPQSGIYQVKHDRVHAQPHEVTAVRGHRFPPCRNCGHGITYTLSHAAHHVDEHPALK
jgi:hypothetical protein